MENKELRFMNICTPRHLFLKRNFEWNYESKQTVLLIILNENYTSKCISENLVRNKCHS